MHTQAENSAHAGRENGATWWQMLQKLQVGDSRGQTTGKADRKSFVHSFAGNVECLGRHPASGDNVKQSGMRRVSLSVAVVGSSLYFQEVCQ